MNTDLWLCALDTKASTGIYISEIGKERLVAIETSNALGYWVNYHTAEQARQMIVALTKALDEIDKAT